MSAAIRKPKSRKPYLLQKPNGQVSARVQAVGPEHFGIVSIDCAKPRSRYLLADFYGRVLIEPSTVPHTRGDLQAAIDRIRLCQQQHDLRDIIVAIERTGEYHRPVQHAFRQANFETRLVHPFTSKQYRQPADPGNKTDDTDLAAIFRATTHGFGLLEPTWPDNYLNIQMLRRHRRNLVDKTSCLQRQIREVLHAAMPGFADNFTHFWESPGIIEIARQTGSAQAVQQAGLDGLKRMVAQASWNCRVDTLHKILAWAEQAPPTQARPHRQQILQTLDDDRQRKTLEIRDLERLLAHLVVQTPYVLLLIIPGINVVSIADLAGELGPIELYANANAITGRAALMPCRYQSDAVDISGPLRRAGNHRIRAVLMQTASNLVTCNHYFRARATQWSRARKDPRWIRVKVAKIFSRLCFAMVAGRQLFAHPCCQKRHYVLAKLLDFHADHQTPMTQTQQDLEAAIAQLPPSAYAQEAQPLIQQLDDLANRQRGPRPLADIIPIVLAKLGARQLQSEVRDQDLG